MGYNDELKLLRSLYKGSEDQLIAAAKEMSNSYVFDKGLNKNVLPHSATDKIAKKHGLSRIDESKNLREAEGDTEDSKDRNYALSYYLGVNECEDEGSNIFYSPDLQQEYVVLTEDEAHENAIQQVKEMIQDQSFEPLSEQAKEDIIDECMDKEALFDYLRQWSDELEEDDPLVGYLDEIIEDDDIGEALFLLDDIGGDIFQFIDLDEAAEYCVRTDGEAHFLAYYDGEEIDLGGGLYAYRTM